MKERDSGIQGQEQRDQGSTIKRKRDSGIQDQEQRDQSIHGKGQPYQEGLGGFHLESIHTDSAAAEVCARERLANTMYINRLGSLGSPVLVFLLLSIYLFQGDLTLY